MQISEPTEFVAVWNSAKDEDRVRCVSPDIIVRIAAGRAPSSNDTLWGSLTFALSRLSTRPVSFVVSTRKLRACDSVTCTHCACQQQAWLRRMHAGTSAGQQLTLPPLLHIQPVPRPPLLLLTPPWLLSDAAGVQGCGREVPAHRQPAVRRRLCQRPVPRQQPDATQRALPELAVPRHQKEIERRVSAAAAGLPQLRVRC